MYLRTYLLPLKNRIPSTLGSVVLWSVISAAFIGPGTVTTAVSAGSQFQLQLLWAVVFSTLACLALQEIAARLTISSNLTLGEAIRKKFGILSGTRLNYLVGGSVILGCAAYEAGNILGAVAGLRLVWPVHAGFLSLLLGLLVAVILWGGKRQAISAVLTLLVGLMGIAFFMLASHGRFSGTSLLTNSIVPQFPAGAGLLTLGLVGTTIVPYNIFLGNGVSRGQTVPLMRIGLTISVLAGGAITAFILLAGTRVPSFSSFEELALVFQQEMGEVGRYALAIGLFAAGFSSAITSPFAAALIAKTVFGWKDAAARWVWIGVLAVGLFFGVTQVKPIPVILLVQTLNGFILPLLGGYLILVINDRQLVQPTHRPTMWYNVVLLVIFATLLLLGLHSIDKTVSQLLQGEPTHWLLVVPSVGVVTGGLAFAIFRTRSDRQTD